MSNAKRGLGRGLGALISSPAVMEAAQHGPVPFMAGRSIIHLDVNKLSPNPRQPRKLFDQDKLEELSNSIKQQGVNSPVLVRRRGDTFEIIAGERRWRAAKKAGLNTIPVIIKDYSDEQSLEIAIVENLQREDLNPIEEALAYKALADEFKLTHEQIAQKVSKDRSTVTNSLRLLDLPADIVDSISSGEIAPGHARPLLGVKDGERQIEIWKETVKNGLSVRDVESLLDIISTHKKKTKVRRQKETNPVIRDVEDKLSEKLGTKVEVHGTPQKGKVIVHYYSQEDLERIMEEVL